MPRVIESRSALKGPSNGLIAILLITSSRPGPKLVFHYPAVPQPPSNQNTNGKSDDLDSDLESDDEDDVAKRKTAAPDSTDDALRGLNALSVDENRDIESETVLGHGIGCIEKLLSPGRWADRKRFEVSLDGITFVGHPVYADEHGNWSNGSGARGDRRLLRDGTAPGTENGDWEALTDEEASAENANIAVPAPSKAAHDFTHIPDSFDSQHASGFATSVASASTTSGVVAEKMNMFHVVFAISSDQQQTAKNVYLHVAKKLSKALHYCQKQSNYVSTESRRLLALRTKGREVKIGMEAVLAQMVERIELAWALMEVFKKIREDKVASIRLNGMEMSLFLPTNTAYACDEETKIEPHSGLLLLEDKDILLRELSHPDASPLAYFIREHNPTKSLQKHSAKINMPINDVLYLASHLVRWRKARVIAPLHARNTYVVSPGAHVERFPELVPQYARKFAAIPPLPQMLKMLSGRPIKYGMLIPSRDHRGPFMDVLAFLVRHEFVTQLRTRGWLKVYSDRSAAGDEDAKVPPNRPPSRVSLLSPHAKALDDDSGSVHSGQSAVTAIAASQTGRINAQARKPGDLAILKRPGPGYIKAQALKPVRESLSDSELLECFPHVLPYLDGEHDLEEIAAREGLKRAKVEECLAVLDSHGYLLTFRCI